MKIRIFLLLSFSCLLGCSTTHCKRAPEQDQTQKVVAPEQVDGIAAKPSGKVFVFKYDGSLQCGMGKKIPRDVMAKQLKKIKIYSSESKYDGMMHIQACGSATGMTNVYEIDAKDQSEAEKLGFKKWDFK